MNRIKFFKRALTVLLCLAMFTVSAAVEPARVQAERQASESLADYVNRCYNSIQSLSELKPAPKVIAHAYLVGTDDYATPSWYQNYETHAMYAVEPDTEIQGYTYDSRYYPQDNMEYLKDLKDNYKNNFAYSNKIYTMPTGAQYLEREGCMFSVVACDENWVTVWDNGYQQWNVYNGAYGAFGEGCQNTVDVYMETHPAGFYKIQRNKVWIDFSLSGNHPYKTEAEIPKAGNGVVTKLAYLRPVPNEDEKEYTPVYALPMGTELNVVSAELVPSQASGSTNKFYKVSFNGSSKVANNEVGYMTYKVSGVYYLDSRYLNFTKKGAELPSGTVPGEITNVTESQPVYAYQSTSTSSEQVGILSLGAEIAMFPSESNESWTAVYFSGQKAYVQTKYIKKAPYKVTDISKLCIADIVNDKLKISWDAGINNVEYSCTIKTRKGKVLWSKKHYKKNSFTIKRKYIENNTSLDIEVWATDKNGNKGKVLSGRILLPLKANKINKKRLVVGRKEIKGNFESLSVQYSTNRKFKKAVTVEKYYKKKGNSGYKGIFSIKKLKPNKTYYIRSRNKKEISTAAGKKWLSGKWSKYIKIKTKA